MGVYVLWFAISFGALLVIVNLFSSPFDISGHGLSTWGASVIGAFKLAIIVSLVVGTIHNVIRWLFGSKK